MSASKAGAARKAKDGIPFWERFVAWWEGYEPRARAVDAMPEPSHGVRYATPRQYWETTRLRLVQELWGEGFSSPGGPDHILKMIKFFGLDPAMSVLDIGAGLGGATRTMCERFGVWVTGLEADQNLAEAGMALSTKAGLAKKAPISHFDPDTFEYKAKSIDCVFSKEFLYTVENKATFLRTVESLLKPRGQLLFTDYVLAKPHLRTDAIARWTEYEPNRPHVWAVEDYKQALAELHLDIRVVEDHTKEFHGFVTRAWADYIVRLEGRGVAAEDAPALTDEVELWARRMQVIESGDIRVCRIHVLKKDTNRLMSSW